MDPNDDELSPIEMRLDYWNKKYLRLRDAISEEHPEWMTRYLLEELAEQVGGVVEDDAALAEEK